MKQSELLIKLQTFKAHVERFKSAYLFKPPSGASSRRYYERVNSQELAFNLGENEYRMLINIECSCRNVYARTEYYLNGEKKNRRILLNLIKHGLKGRVSNYKEC